MAKFLDPRADIVFKKIFGEHPHLLKSFLNAVLPLDPEQQIVHLTYLTPEQIPAIPTFKRTIVDVKCTDKRGRIFIVEMQIVWTEGFKQRLLFGASQAVVKQLEKGQDYHLLQPVYGLGMVGQNYDPSSEWYHHYQLVKKDDANGDVIEHLQLIFIEMLKFADTSPEHSILRMLWLRFFREINEKTTEVPADFLQVPEISEAVSLAQEAAYNKAELEYYERYWDAVSTEKTLMSGKYQEGLKEGQRMAKLEVARSMLELGLSPDLICKTTSLSSAEIKKLSKT